MANKILQMKKNNNNIEYCSEGDVKRDIKQYLEDQGHFVFNILQGSIRNYRNKNGISDLIGCLKGGKFIAVEVKFNNNKASQEQIAFLREVQERGGISVVARSVDDVKKAIKCSI